MENIGGGSCQSCSMLLSPAVGGLHTASMHCREARRAQGPGVHSPHMPGVALVARPLDAAIQLAAHAACGYNWPA